MNNNRIFCALTGMAALGSSAAATAEAPARKAGKEPQRPNIILIMTDDMGFSDIGCYGGLIETPNLDRLAADGLRYMQFYNVGRSCPTRASLMTGLYPHQAGLGHMIHDRGEEGYRGEINHNCVTIGEVLRDAGYHTLLSGKWHLSRYLNEDEDISNWPLQRGFDKFYGIIHGACSYYDPFTLTRGNKRITPLSDPEYRNERFYFTDAITDNAIQFIHGATQQDDRPYFLYLAYTAAHWPMQAFEEDVQKYKGKFDRGWDVLRREKYDAMVRAGIIDPQWDQTPRDGIPAWDSLTQKQKRFEIRRMMVYAAMVSRMDMNVGRLVDYLTRTGQLDNTVILFLQDNGACAEDFLSKGRIRMVPLPNGASIGPMDDDEFIPDMIPFKNRKGQDVWMGEGLVMGADTTWGSYGKGWANVSNVPFREYKHWVHEGGVATPLIVHWPAGIKARNDTRRQPSHLIDIMATCIDLANANYPAEYHGNRIKPLEGRSLVPTFRDRDAELDREAIYFEHEGNRAVRMGKWKLVSKTGRYTDWIPTPFGKWELYDMEKDRTEMHDLSARHPELVKQMAGMWDAYAHRANVFPLPKSRIQ